MNEVKQLRNLMEAFDEIPPVSLGGATDDKIFDAYRDGKLSYEEAEAQLNNLFRMNPDDMEMAMSVLNTMYGDQEVEWDEESGGGVVSEAVGDYTLYHDSLTSAIQEVDRLLARKGYAMDPDHAADVIGFGPAKPQPGDTNKYSVKLRQGDKHGPLTKKHVQIQVYNRGIDGNTYELNTYVG